MKSIKNNGLWDSWNIPETSKSKISTDDGSSDISGERSDAQRNYFLLSADKKNYWQC